MSLSIAIVGPGRVGAVLACLWRRSGCDVQGFVGRTDASVRRAVEVCGGGRQLTWPEVAACDVIALTPPDDQLARVVAKAAAERGSAGANLWLHTSGVFDLDVLQPLAPSGLGSLHPVCPVPDVEAGLRGLPGKPAVLDGDPNSLPLLGDLARRAGMRPVQLGKGANRAVYHAACALAANGLTALADRVQSLLRDHAGLGEGSAASLSSALMRAALDAVDEHGAAAALSGPVQRGDRAIVQRHLEALARSAPESIAIYCELMQLVAELAGRGGRLDAGEVKALVRQLREFRGA